MLATECGLRSTCEAKEASNNELFHIHKYVVKIKDHFATNIPFCAIWFSRGPYQKHWIMHGCKITKLLKPIPLVVTVEK